LVNKDLNFQIGSFARVLLDIIWIEEDGLMERADYCFFLKKRRQFAQLNFYNLSFK